MVADYSLYIHVPFCTRKCDYCHFYVIPDQERHKKQYLAALKKEWQLRNPGYKPRTIYFGGGTPTLLGYETIAEILSWIDYDPTIEITLEANPESLHHFKPCGINRISLGVQSFDDQLLTILTRTHQKSEAIQAIENVHAQGIENISIDLMYDLPHQTLDQWTKSLQQAIKLPITHLSFYNLTFEPHTAFYKKQKTLTPHLPTDDISLQMLQHGIHILEENGFARYEIASFAKPGFESQHNSGYWTGRPFLGLGPSAFSFWNKSRFRNIANLNRYSKLLADGKTPTDFSEKLSPQQAENEHIAIALRLLKGVKTSPENFSELIAEGFLDYSQEHLKLTEKGRLFYDTVAERII